MLSMRERISAIGMSLSFYAILAVLYPTTKVLELGELVYTTVRTHMLKERT